ncbi:DNA adenine methylase [Gilliamella bombicola]|uniref:Site-specific DNA-methyltransferase (adenine-specific) n=1 Tax=Gilliamella bombicola TaxID=1798182 RepID=A0A1C3Z0H9_9GAMM|nr:MULTISPECIES: Dam family site-specific DNA-(adenine-N6)-methyltransferase [Gilliamella]NUF27557.1 Dam family site-specific DNA-(adenine-N6)-methyltransferase [Gilliamella sp. ESL0254]SCB75770.1 DNA adenine methylase [Gilliamella bombicola]
MKKRRAFLKWAGGKYELVDTIKRYLPEGDQLIEPFVGAGSVFLNTNYKSYILADINHDLISLFKLLQSSPDKFIHDLRLLFTAQNNHPDAFYQLRDVFNGSQDQYFRSLLFVYLNRHCYNGLCRYNNRGLFNVPFGRYKTIYFPEKELYFFAEKAQRAQFICAPYYEVMKQAKQNSVIYCDPPYISPNESAGFTAYYSNIFGFEEHKNLSKLAENMAYKKNIPVLVSNHYTDYTMTLYSKASQLYRAEMRRSISCAGEGRKKIDEILALYKKP